MTQNAFKRHLITAALPYANGPVHIGHLAGCYLPADIYVRYLRSKGEDVVFICGSDEHGVPITIKAKQEGKQPQDVVDHYHRIMQEAFKEFGISFNHYSRTSSKIHHQTAADFFKTLHDQNGFQVQETEQYFDTEAQQFLADRYITGTCPKCMQDGAYGDQCERCGTSLNPTDLIQPRSKLSGNTPVLKKTKNWFLPLDRLQPKIKAYIESHAEWKTNVFGQCKSWLDQEGGLQPRAMTRDLDWGVKVPIEDAAGKVLYVWFDAPIGYISATKEYLPDTWQQYWKQNDTRLIHFIGKDNIVFHCIIFPAMLMEHGGFILPDAVPANEFLNLEGEKISTSRNWAVWLHEYLNDFPNQQDVLRYVLCANAPETKDNDFTWHDFQARNNNELVAILGNFINRTLVLTEKYFQNTVPTCGIITEKETALEANIRATPKAVSKALDQFKFREALTEVMNLARAGNKYLADTEPWKAISHNADYVATILNYALQLAAHVCILMEPFLPFTSKRLQHMLQLKATHWNTLDVFIRLEPGHRLEKSELLFSKLDDITIAHQISKLKPAEPVNTTQLAPLNATCTFEDFQKADIRIATILHAERVPKTEKLLKLILDTGIDERTVVSGIAADYKPEQIIGTQVCIVANLAPRKIKGIESKGMILMAEQPDGKLLFVRPDAIHSVNGAKVK